MDCSGNSPPVTNRSTVPNRPGIEAPAGRLGGEEPFGVGPVAGSPQLSIPAWARPACEGDSHEGSEH